MMAKYKKYLIIFAVILAALLVAPIVRWAVVGAYDSVSSSIRNKIRQAEDRDRRERQAKIERRQKECEAQSGYPAERIRKSAIRCSVDKMLCPTSKRERYGIIYIRQNMNNPLARAVDDAFRKKARGVILNCIPDKKLAAAFESTRLCTAGEFADYKAKKAELKAVYEKAFAAWVAHVDRELADEEAKRNAQATKYYACLRGE